MSFVPQPNAALHAIDITEPRSLKVDDIIFGRGFRSEPWHRPPVSAISSIPNDSNLLPTRRPPVLKPRRRFVPAPLTWR